MKLALAVLVSGRGTNLQAVLDAVADGRLSAVISGVVCDRARAALSGRRKLVCPRRWCAWRIIRPERNGGGAGRCGGGPRAPPGPGGACGIHAHTQPGVPREVRRPGDKHTSFSASSLSRP